MREQSSIDLIEFQFTLRNDPSAANGSRSGAGTFNGATLKIWNMEIDVSQIRSLFVDESTFVFGIVTDDGKLRQLEIEIYSTDTVLLRDAINASRSRVFAQQQRVRLTQSGELAKYRDHRCPFCASTIVLTGLPETPQIYCPYCDTLFSVDREIGDDIEQNFRLCDQCNMYSRPRKFAVFYFYFLVFTFGFHHDTTVRCSGCMRSSAWKMVIGNLFGLLGVPFALAQLYRSYRTQSLSGRFEGLDTANVLARRGKVDRALELYESVMDAVPENAGIKYNVGFGLMLKKDFAHAQQLFELSLDDCCNYWPSVNGLVRALQMQGKFEEVESVYKIWGHPEDQDS